MYGIRPIEGSDGSSRTVRLHGQLDRQRFEGVGVRHARLTHPALEPERQWQRGVALKQGDERGRAHIQPEAGHTGQAEGEGEGK
jgi:hypothetical protein